jgi:hypothetical protein
MKRPLAAALFATSCLAFAAPAAAADAAGIDRPKIDAPRIDPDDIGGVVSGPRGPEAGVWVIAETRELPTRFIRIVVTDEAGRFVVPDLPPATYKLWVRGYGLVDSKPVDAAPGRTVALAAAPAPDAKAAAQYYPPNYWVALLRMPAASEFPGTGPNGNGISPGMRNQQDWIGHFKENCEYCHQLGDKATRELEAANHHEGWDARVKMGRSPDDPIRGDQIQGQRLQTAMNNNMSRFGRPRALTMFADWTDRIAKGELPPEAPPRPQGVERNLVVTIQDWANGRFVHDSSASDKRNPGINAKGPIYGVATHSGVVTVLQPDTHKTPEIQVPGLKSPSYNMNAMVHTTTMDEKGRVWMTDIAREGENPAFCTDGALNPSAGLFPRESKTGRTLSVYDPAANKVTRIPVCFSSHHLNFATDKDSTLYFSGDTEVVGWINTHEWDRTHDSAKATGWCPLVLDTSGDGRITQDRSQWNQPDAAPAARDPAKDTRIQGFLYGMGVDPRDGSSWAAKYSPQVPSGIVHVSPGRNPPATCMTEYFEPPLVNGKYLAFNARGVDVDANGIAWVAFGTGQVASFDRTRCKVTSGPTATGQHCPEGWHFYETPGPKLAGTDIGADWHYLTWVDLHDSLGLGKNVPLVPGSNSDSLVAIMPDSGKMVTLRVPYPMGFYTRGIDGRIDDAKAGWKGRGLWSSYSEAAIWHQEGGEGELSKMVKFQMRPDPLAH